MIRKTPNLASALLIALAVSPCAAQVGSGQSSPFGRNGMMPTTAAPQSTASPELLKRSKTETPRVQSEAPVLSEGTFLASVKGFFAPSLREPGLLTFRLNDRMVTSAPRSLFVMPCDHADDVKAILDDPRVDSPTLFEVTGSIYECDDRSYLLPVAVVALRAPAAPGMLARIAPAELRRAAVQAEGPRPPRIEAYADLASAELAATPTRHAPVDRRSHEPNTAIFAGLDDGFADSLERSLDAGIAASGMGIAVKRDIVSYDRSLLLPPATRFQERRASVLRDPVTGVWRARLDTARAGTGAHDGAEVSMEVLPTKALHKLEKLIRQRPIGTTWLLSGEVVVSKERSYLLLTRAIESPIHKFMSP